MAIVCRTVLDLRSPLDKYLSQTLLLAASWHRHCADHSALEVLTVGDGNAAMSAFFDRLGVGHAAMAPGPNDDFSRSSNKIEAASPDPEGRRVLLLDNDVCFFGGLRELDQVPATAIAASEAGTLRVDDAQWTRIADELGLPLLRRRFTAINDLPADGSIPDPAEHYLYVNSGVVLFPAGHDHRPAWRTHQRRIYEYFRDHPLGSDAVTTSDQAGFATSLAAHGDFAWLPLRFNYRRACFGVGLETAGRIGIVHFTGDIADAQARGVAQRIDAYWKEYVLPRLASIPGTVPAAEARRRRDVASAIHAAALDLVRDYDLERWLRACQGARVIVSPT